MASHRYSESQADVGEGDAAGARDEEPLWLKTSRRAASAKPSDRKPGARVAWDASTDGVFGARRVADKDTQLKVSKRAASVKPWDPQPGKLPLTSAPNLVRSSANSPRDHLARDGFVWFRIAMLPGTSTFSYTLSRVASELRGCAPLPHLIASKNAGFSFVLNLNPMAFLGFVQSGKLLPTWHECHVSRSGSRGVLCFSDESQMSRDGSGSNSVQR